jgi:hypothetical protein
MNKTESYFENTIQSNLENKEMVDIFEKILQY